MVATAGMTWLHEYIIIVIIVLLGYVSRRSGKTESSGKQADVTRVKKTPDVVMYDEVGLNHLVTANEISLTKNSAYHPTDRNRNAKQ